MESPKTEQHAPSTSGERNESFKGGLRRSNRRRPPNPLMESHQDNEEMPVLEKERSLDPLSFADDIPSTPRGRSRLPKIRATDKEALPSNKTRNKKRSATERSKAHPSKTPSNRKRSATANKAPPPKKCRPVEQQEESVESDKPTEVFNGVTFTVPPRPENTSCCFICPDVGITSTRPDGVPRIIEIELEDNTADTRLDENREEPANIERGLVVMREVPDEVVGDPDAPEAFIVSMEDPGVREEVVVSMDIPAVVIQRENLDEELEDIASSSTMTIPRRTVKKEEPDEYESVGVSSMDTTSTTRLMVVKKELYVNGEKEEVTTTNCASDYIKCGIRNCTQKMHKKCLEGYICSEYSPGQAQLLFNVGSPVCPAHFCWHCYEERSKNASRFGEMVDCEKCMRSFHVECMPAGTKISKQEGKKKTFVCHYHTTSNPPKITKTMRLKYCTECEEIVEDKPDEGDEDGMQRMECKGCTNVFHKKCGYKEVKGQNCEKYANQGYCTYCVNGAVIVPNQTVLAYCGRSFGLKAGNYPATAMAISDIPKDMHKRLGSNLGKIGYIPVRWIWNDVDIPYYNVIHMSQVQRMTRNCEKNLPDGNFMAELKKCKNKFLAPTRPLDNEAMKRTITIIKRSCYSQGLKRPQNLEKQDLQECTCKPNAQKIKCDTSLCANRASNYECSKSCDDEAKGIKCANRSMQIEEEKYVKKYEVKAAPDGKGLGVFAICIIKPLEFIFEYAGEVIDKEELAKREDRMAKLRSNDEWTYTMGLVPPNVYVDARFKGGEARFANHSCSPNAEVQTIDIPVQYKNSNEKAVYEHRLKVQALRTIRPGEEITFNYGLTKSRKLAIDNCRCRSEKCSGKIGKNTKNDDGDDERFDANQMMSDSDGEGEGEGRYEEKENKKKRTPRGKTPKKNEKSEEEEKKKHRRSISFLPRQFDKKNGKSEEEKETPKKAIAKRHRFISLPSKEFDKKK